MSEAATIHEVRVETINRLRLKPGDILLVKLGADLGDDQPPWIPSYEDIHEYQKDYEKIIPDGVKVLVTHFGVEASVIEDVRDN